MGRRSPRVADGAEVLAHWAAGRSQRQIARSLGLDRNTVKKDLAPVLVAGFHTESDPPPEGWPAFVARGCPRLGPGKQAGAVLSGLAVFHTAIEPGRAHTRRRCATPPCWCWRPRATRSCRSSRPWTPPRGRHLAAPWSRCGPAAPGRRAGSPASHACFQRTHCRKPAARADQGRAALPHRPCRWAAAPGNGWCSTCWAWTWAVGWCSPCAWTCCSAPAEPGGELDQLVPLRRREVRELAREGAA